MRSDGPSSEPAKKETETNATKHLEGSDKAEPKDGCLQRRLSVSTCVYLWYVESCLSASQSSPLERTPSPALSLMHTASSRLLDSGQWKSVKGSGASRVWYKNDSDCMSQVRETIALIAVRTVPAQMHQAIPSAHLDLLS